MKAAYIQNFGELIRTHDLVYLGKKINLPDDLLEICDEINSFYIETRYPDTYTEFDEECIEEIINKAENVLKWMRAHIL